MKTLQDKLKLVPSPIREMIEEAIATTPTIKYRNIELYLDFWFHDNTVFIDPSFWSAVYLDLEYHAEQFNKKKK